MSDAVISEPVCDFQNTVEHGAWAEQKAVELLEARGYRIAEQNYRCKCGEIDIVAYDGATIVFVEVRSRSNAEHGMAAEHVTRSKQRQVVRVAEYFLLERDPMFVGARFDVVAITGRDVEHFIDAFRSTRR